MLNRVHKFIGQVDPTRKEQGHHGAFSVLNLKHYLKNPKPPDFVGSLGIQKGCIVIAYKKGSLGFLRYTLKRAKDTTLPYTLYTLKRG